MSEAKENYYAWCDKMMFADGFPPNKYIKELEHELDMMSRSNKILCKQILEVKQQKAELIEFVKDVERNVNYSDAPITYIDCREILNKLQKEN